MNIKTAAVAAAAIFSLSMGIQRKAEASALEDNTELATISFALITVAHESGYISNSQYMETLTNLKEMHIACREVQFVCENMSEYYLIFVEDMTDTLSDRELELTFELIENQEFWDTANAYLIEE